MINLVRQIFRRYPFLKFLMVGVLNTAFGYVSFAVFLFLVKNPYLALTLSTVVAILFNFRTYGRIVFKSKDNSLVYKFFAVYLSLMLLQMALLKVLTEVVGIQNTYVAGAILTLPMALLAFKLMRKFVFPHPPPVHEEKT